MARFARKTAAVQAATILAVAIAASTVTAKPHFRLLATTASPVLTDGSRYAAYKTRDGQSRVLDDLAGRSYLVQTPAACSPSSVPPSIKAVGGGQIVFETCTDDNDVAMVGIQGGTPFRPPGYQPQPYTADGTPRPSVLSVGRRWIEVINSGYHFSYRSYLDWRTGESRRDPDSPTVVPDLDASGLDRGLCSPLSRRLGRPNDATDNGSKFWRYQYEPPFGLSVEGSTGERLLLDRCGRASKVLNGECFRPYPSYSCGSSDAQLGGGMVTWSAGPEAHALVPRTGRSWRTDKARSVAHTRKRVFVSVHQGPGPGKWHVYVAAPPGPR